MIPLQRVDLRGIGEVNYYHNALYDILKRNNFKVFVRGIYSYSNFSHPRVRVISIEITYIIFPSTQLNAQTRCGVNDNQDQTSYQLDELVK